jgi:hypothetical protein
MNRTKLRNAIDAHQIQWRRHALERMLERNILRSEVVDALKSGEIIEIYAHDKPHASALFFHSHKDAPIHVVASLDEALLVVYVITAYRPDGDTFLEDMKTRRKT